jgi:DNA-binding response OmpR family regulator
VDGYVQRPYSSVRLRETLQEIGAASGSAGADCDGAPAGEVKGKSILLLDRDPEVVSRVREHLEPLGVEVGVRSWDEAVAAGGAGGAQAIVIGWPLPEGFTFDTLREIRGGAERLPVVLLSSAGREVVQARSPALYGASSMLFTKPVPWKHFFHFLMRILRQAPALPDEAGVSPPAEGEADLRRSFQSQLEAKFLEVEELKSRLREVEKGKETAPETAAFGRLEEENAELRERIREVERKQEVESAKQRLRETELEDKLGNIIRTKTEAERHSQDLIDAAEEKAEETARALEETRGELQVRQEEVAALRKDLEQALVEKEGAEERVQASLLQMGKEKKTLEEERAALESRAEEALALAEGLKGCGSSGRRPVMTPERPPRRFRASNR